MDAAYVYHCLKKLIRKLRKEVRENYISNSTDEYGEKTIHIITLSEAEYTAIVNTDINTLYFTYE